MARICPLYSSAGLYRTPHRKSGKETTLKRIFLALGATFAMLVPAATQAQVVSGEGVTLKSCTIVENTATGSTSGIQVMYTNTHSSPATEVDFVVHYRGHTFTFVDRGKFEMGAVVDHKLTNQMMNFKFKGKNPDLCKVNRVLLANGQTYGP
jgi:hypothetical protein